MSGQRDFIIAWLDDDEANIEAIKSDLEAHIRFCGWNPVIKDFRTDSPEFQAVVDDPRTCLIITDLNLLYGQYGSNVIQKLQANGLWHEILLYSAHAESLFKAVQGLDGIFYYAFNDHKGLREKIEAVFQAIIVKDSYTQIRLRPHAGA